MLKNFSVTQVNTFRDCPRQWFDKYVLRKVMPPSPDLDRGNHLHTTLECYLKGRIENGSTFTPPPEHRVYVEKLVSHYPAHDEKALVEHWMHMPTQFGIEFVGKIDLVRYQLQPAKLIDWKTTGNKAFRYALTPDELQKDVQAGVYAHYLYEEGLDRPIHAGLVYLYMPDEPPVRAIEVKTLPVFNDIDRAQARKTWESIQKDLERMLELSTLTDRDKVEAKTTACDKYRGCPFKTDCGITSLAGTGRHKTKETMTMGSFFGKNGNGKSESKPKEEVKANKEEAKAKTGEETFTEKIQRKKAAEQAAQETASTSQDAPRTRRQPASQQQGQRGALQAATQPFSIIPPDAPPRDSGGADPLPEDAAPVVAAESDGDGETESRGRGRPKGSTKKKGFSIYVDCLPTKGGGDVTIAEDWWGPIEMKLNEFAVAQRKAHYMELDFGPQKAAIALAVQEKITAGGLPPTMLVSSSSSSFNRDVLPLLIPHATQVVKALRG